ncbi:MAG TPA: hypothetical protein VKE22_04070 [Haliangiales bacterium]|nr:hypothetical protein [Haliangiales bacterium]
MSARGWKTHAWLLGLAAATIVLHLPWLVPGGPWARRPEALVLGQDEGMALYDSLRILRGEVMYRDFFQFHGPVFYYLHAALFFVVGPSFTAARVLFVLTTTTSTVLLAAMVARHAGRVAGVAAGLVHACLLVALWPFAYPHWYAETFALGGLFLITRERSGARGDVAGGALLGLSILTTQSTGLPALLAAAAAAAGPGLAARDLRRSLARPARILLGAVAGVAPLLVYLAAQGALGLLYYDMFRWPFENYHFENEGFYGFQTPEAIAAHRKLLGEPWATLGTLALRENLLLPFFALAGAAAAIPVAVWKIVRRQEDDWAPIVTAAACLGGVSTLFLAPVRADFHHIAYGGPFGLLALSLAARRPRLRPAVLATLCLAAALAVVTYAHKTAFTWSASRAKGSFRAEAEKLAGYAAIARAVPPDGTIVVGPMAGFYYFFLRDAAVPITHIPSTQDKFLTDEQWRWCAERIAALGPGAILLPPKPWRELVARRPDLRDRYRPQGELLVRSP